MMDVERVEGGGTGSARRQRERRLRSMLRHERLAVAMAVAEALHHSSGPSPARRPTGPGDRHQSRGGGGASLALRPTGTEDSSTRGAAGQSHRARAAAERPQIAGLRRGRPPDPWPAGTGWGVGRGCGRLHAPLPHGFCVGGQKEGAGGGQSQGAEEAEGEGEGGEGEEDAGCEVREGHAGALRQGPTR